MPHKELNSGIYFVFATTRHYLAYSDEDSIYTYTASSEADSVGLGESDGPPASMELLSWAVGASRPDPILSLDPRD